MSSAQSCRSKTPPAADPVAQNTTDADPTALDRAPTADRDDYLAYEKDEPSTGTRPKGQSPTGRPRSLRRLSSDAKVTYIVAKENIVEKTISAIGAMQAKWLGGTK